MASNSKIFTFEEVAKHNHKKDCWVLIDGKVYDVTSYLDDHPGGDEPLLTSTGKDATDDFEDVGHSLGAREEMEKYFVGDLDISTLPVKAKFTPPAAAPKQTQAPAAAAPLKQAQAPAAAAVSNQRQSSGFVVKILQYVVPLLMLGFAFALKHYGKKSKSIE